MVVFAPGPLIRIDRAEPHRFAGIHDADQVKVGLLLVLLEVNLVGLAKHLPIDVTDVVAGHILPMLRELDRDPLVGRTMHAGHQAFYDEPGTEVEGADSGKGVRVEVPAIVGRIGGNNGHNWHAQRPKPGPTRRTLPRRYSPDSSSRLFR